MSNQDISKLQDNLLKFLKELQDTESKLWGVTINQLVSGEEEILEDTNHFIYKLQSHSNEELKEFFSSHALTKFKEEIKKLHEDFKYLKRKVNEQNKLKNLITSFTLKLVDKKTYPKLEEIFLLEKQLQEVLEQQEEGFNELLKDINKIRIKEIENKEIIFIETLKQVRTILAGHLDHHSLWEEERQGFSNISNILNSLSKLIKESI